MDAKSPCFHRLGLSCDDAYFARTVPLEQRPGRIYVGYLAPMLNRQQCLAPLAAALLLAPYVLFESEQDAAGTTRCLVDAGGVSRQP